jgi:uncharacterized SAM-binding protein YcdF (DUF218 family)
LVRSTLERGLRFLLKFILRAAISVICLVTLVAVFAYYYPEKFLCVDSGQVAAADVIIVLGGGNHERAGRAAELFKQHYAPRIIHTGEGDDGINRQLLREAGVPTNVIELESKSTTTRENAEFTIRLLRAEKVHRAILVTSWYHSRRALATFQHYAPEIKFYSRPSYYAFDRSDWSRLRINKKLWLEFVKLPGYWICYGVH